MIFYDGRPKEDFLNKQHKIFLRKVLINKKHGFISETVFCLCRGNCSQSNWWNPQNVCFPCYEKIVLSKSSLERDSLAWSMYLSNE